MQDPFSAAGRYRMIYWLSWVLLGAAYALINMLLWHTEVISALIDAGIFATFFALMGIAVWYVVRFSGFERGNIINTLVTHLVAGALLVFVAVAAGERVLTVIYPVKAEIYGFDSYFHIYRLIIGGLLYILTAFNFYMVVYYEENRSQKLRQNELDQHLKTAELNMLKAQINPHFIFNSLNSVSSLTLTDPQRAHEMVIQLADFLRYTIQKNVDQLVSLEKEVEAVELFLAIERTRYGDRLSLVINCDEHLASEMTVPVLILQPIVENAIKYSLHETAIDSSISIHCSVADENLVILVSNNYEPDRKVKKGAGIGLSNVRARLKLIYGRTDLLEVQEEQDQFTVKITFPQ